MRVQDDKQRMLLEAARAAGGQLTQNEAARLIRSFLSIGLLTTREGKLLMGACTDGALSEIPPEHRDRIRAAVFRCAILGITT